MNVCQWKQYKRAAGKNWRKPQAVMLWLQCRHLADHEGIQRRPGELQLLWFPYWGRCDGASLIALTEFCRCVGCTLHSGRGAFGPVFLLTRQTGRGRA